MVYQRKSPVATATGLFFVVEEGLRSLGPRDPYGSA